MYRILKVLSCFFLIAPSFSINAGNLSSTTLRSNEYLNSMSNEFNKILPKRIDKHIELITTIGKYSTLTLFYRTVSLTAYQAKDINLIEGIKKPSTEFVCSNPVFNNLLQAGVLIIAKYVAMDYKDIGAIKITKESCPS